LQNVSGMMPLADPNTVTQAKKGAAFKGLSLPKVFTDNALMISPSRMPTTLLPLAPDFETPHFKSVLSRFATGIAVITALAGEDAKGDATSNPFVGITISSFNSVSLSPPLVLWSLGQRSSNLQLLRESTHYVVNILAADQLDVCQRFASGKGDRFAQTDYSLGKAGLPILKGALAWFECHNRNRHEEGDHVIFVGEVERCGFSENKPPLVYHTSQFVTTSPLA